MKLIVARVEDAKDRVWKQMICCGDPKREKLKVAIYVS